VFVIPIFIDPQNPLLYRFFQCSEIKYICTFLTTSDGWKEENLQAIFER
jgi:hypothetical protein